MRVLLLYEGFGFSMAEAFNPCVLMAVSGRNVAAETWAQEWLHLESLERVDSGSLIGTRRLRVDPWGSKDNVLNGGGPLTR